jgi:tRNA A-37 threonylcarbamoyl transferase component Bud32
MKTFNRIMFCGVCKKYLSHEIIVIKERPDKIYITKKCNQHENAERIHTELSTLDLNHLP